MRSSNDNDRAEPVGISSLGVVDTSIVSDVFGLRAFDSRETIYRMLELRATPAWRARRIVPSDVTSVRRRWTKILFATVHKRQAYMENLRRPCRNRPDGRSAMGGLAIAPSVKST